MKKDLVVYDEVEEGRRERKPGFGRRAFPRIWYLDQALR